MTKRQIATLSLTDFEPVPVPTARPEVTWINPRDLLVDEAYQRNLSDRSLALIRRIATAWDWRKFKAPNCAWTADGLEVIDGQHTAIGAACRPDIAEIPVLITEAAEQADRAAAFIGLNRDRVGITATQIHAAAVTAGDAEAVAIEEACASTGITILKNPPGSGFKPRQTMAVAAIGALLKRHGTVASKALLALRALAAADLAPIQSNHIKAVELLLTDPEFGQPEADDITKAIVTMGAEGEREAKLFAATHCVPVWRGLAAVWFKKMPKRRKAPSPVAIFDDPVGVYGPPQSLPAPPKAPAYLDDMKRDERSARTGWAPGRHIRRCAVCDCRFQGAISASCCADCAYEAVEGGSQPS